MAEETKDDLNQTTPSGRDKENPPSTQPSGDSATEEISNSEDVAQDERINDRFQATDN